VVTARAEVVTARDHAMLTGDDGMVARAWQVARSVPDPELPMVTIAELGMLRNVTMTGARVVVALTPTYAGCPAIAEIRADVAGRLTAAGFPDVEVRTELTPPWTSDLISADGRRKLAEAGVAPPRSRPEVAAGTVPLTLFTPAADVACPVCGSADTQQIAAFGSTACKDLYRCRSCAEPFEHVKEI
jgi:ring-1,2-phenylacetyl-CoA epoxidase subunit PaaD